MKILLVSNAVVGGAGKACHRLYDALRHAGADVRLLYLEGRPSTDPNVVQFYPRARDIFLKQLLFLPWSRMQSRLLGDRRYAYRLPNSIHRLEEHPLVEWADVINLHWVPDFVDYQRFFRKVGGKPVVWTMHDMLPFAGGYHYETEMTGRVPAIEARIAEKKTRAVAASKLGVVAPSSWLLGVSQRHEPFKARPHRHIFNGVPLDRFKPIERAVARDILNLPPAKKIILFTADNVAANRKGLRHLLEAVPAINAHDVVLVSVGRGRVPVGGSLEYHHLGMLADEVSIALCYAAADLVVVPSIEDNSPNIIVESFACGRPVVAFAVGGIPELISSPDLGVLVPEPNGSALAAGIDTALGRTYCTNAIRTHAAETFDYPSLAARYLSMYQEVAAL